MVPVLVGKEQLRVMGIKLQKNGYDSGYDIVSLKSFTSSIK